MAYYPGNYYSGFQHIGDYYSQGLFGATSQRPHDFDPYSDSYHEHEQHHHHHETSRPSRRHPRTTHNTSHTLPSSLPPRPSQRRSASPPSRSPHPLEHAPPPPPPPPRPRSKTPPQLPQPPAPPAPAPPPTATPSSSYLDFASIPSQTLSEPTRKLLVLDLNGSLLLRSARIPKSYRGHHIQNQFPAPRRVMPRPYLPAFRAYLFAPQTRAWLDVMVWSSAQPHSVQDMVSHAFGDDRDQLIAIWARDTLGLAEDHYYRKVQTIKDLERPWAALTSQPPASPSSSSSSSQTWTGHSAATTILLDDSHAKAARQPYNHLCVPEYTRALRNVDLVALQHEQDAAEAEAAAAAAAAAAREEAEEPTTPDALSPSSSPPGQEKREKRKRKKEKQQLVRAASSLAPDHVDHADGDVSATAPTSFDETLLAVIGILHASRLQSSIAGWIRAGTLLSERGEVWCDDPASMHAWALRGREALHELQLDVEHGVIPDP